MGAGVTLDTSFLICLADRKRAGHEAAKKYWKYFLDSRIPIYLPTIVISEFSLKQQIDSEILRCCIVEPFNHADALKSAELNFTKYKGAPRDALKDDFKIIAQAEVRKVAYLITDDADTMYKYCKSLKEAGQVSFDAIRLQDGFDLSLLNGGQKDFHDVMVVKPGEED